LLINCSNFEIEKKGHNMNLSRGAQRLLDLLRWYGARFRRIHPAQIKLGMNLKVSIATVKRWLLELKQLGAVIVQKYGPHSAEYELQKAVLAQIDGEENERSMSGLRAVYERSVSGLTGPILNVSLPVSVNSYIHKSKKHTGTQAQTPPQRKPAQMEDKFDRALTILRAQGYK
jgi:hypothetical protein